MRGIQGNSTHIEKQLFIEISWKNNRASWSFSISSSLHRSNPLALIFFEIKSPCVRPHYTYPSNHLKVLLPVEINGFPIEKPLEDGTQRRISGHLAGQHKALSHGGVQTQGRNYDLGRLYGNNGGRKRCPYGTVSIQSRQMKEVIKLNLPGIVRLILLYQCN